MNDMIRITERDGKKAVSARELYVGLGFKDNNFTKFCDRYIIKNEYAIQGVDYQCLVLHDEMPNGGLRDIKDYAISVDLSKRICMLSRTLAGENIRNYFIEKEKEALALKPISTLDILEMAIKGLREHQADLDEIKTDIKQLKASTQTRPDVYTAAGFLNLKGIKATLPVCIKIGTAASKVCRKNGWDTGTCPDPRFGTVKTYPAEALEKVYGLI